MHDIFPARLKTPSGTYPKCRVIVDDGRAVVWARNGRGPLTKLADVAASGIEPVPRRPRTFTVATDEGDWIVSKSGGSG